MWSINLQKYDRHITQCVVQLAKLEQVLGQVEHTNKFMLDIRAGIPCSAILGQMDTIGLEGGVRKRRQHEDVGDARLVVHTVECYHNRVVPTDKPEWHTSEHRWQKQHLENK